MEISNVVIKGFRNFEDCTVNLIKKTLIIGSNDVGKTNFLHALRLLLDRSLSEVDIEPKDSDFFAYNDTNEFSITISFIDVSDAARAKFRESIGENDTLVLKFLGSREVETGKKDYKIYAGEEDDIAIMDELQGRYYLRSLNMKYIGSNRNLSSLIKREKRFLLQEAKEERTEQEIIDDNTLRTGVQTKLENINSDIHRLNYMQTATNGINKELKSLSVRHDNHEVIFL